MNTTSMSVSVILEWENATHASQDRPRQTLAALRTQASECFSDTPSFPSNVDSRVRLPTPLDLIIPYDSNEVDESEVRRVVSEFITESESLHVRMIPVGDGTYCRQKNAGAAVATGEIIILLDSDVTPEPNWLASFMRAFSDPRVQVAVGNTYVDISPGDAYSRSMALTWMFPLRDTEGGLRPSDWFYANNVAFRREILLSHPFPHTPGLKHHPATLLVRQLEQEGITLWHVGDARGHHPTPNGIVHFCQRAIAAGRARAFTHDSVALSSVADWIRRDALEVGWYVKRIVREGAKVGMHWWQMPAAMGVTLAYHLLRSGGSLLTAAAPGLMRNRFEL
ncbi:MAG: glycosyltransferase family 2 protein [Nitrospira sp.]|nr:MAG: glycosyltransferase family 2 protein [Nitrospira sp.]